MFNEKIGILEPDNFSNESIKLLEKLGSVSQYKGGSIKKFINNKTILFVRLKYNISDYIDKKTSIKIICSPTTGHNHLFNISKKIKIISLKGDYEFLSNIRATPEHIIGLSLALLRRYKHSFLNINNKNWNRDLYIGEELFRNKIGIIGMGRIGKIISLIYQSFGCDVYWFDTKKISNSNKYGFIQDNIQQLISNSNIIILNIDYSDSNDKLFDKKYFKLLNGKYFINTSRGENINEIDLLKFLEENKFKGVALDVISDESKKNNLNLILKNSENKNVLITPHIGGASLESINKTELFITTKLYKFLGVKQ